MKVSILGTIYTIIERSEEEDINLKDNDGYCDRAKKKIVIVDGRADYTDSWWEWQRKKIMRHEIIHAFLNESGLIENFAHIEYGQEETTIDWIAIQFPKMLEAFKVTGCL